MRKITDINLAAGVLHWDQEVNMPPKGAAFRAQQLATLSEISHNFSIDTDYGKLLESLYGESNLSEDDWNAKYKKYLNIDVPSDSKGVLQDIHWSHGSFGYFPTYSLGSFYATQFYNQAKEEITDLEQEIEQGNMQPLLAWLRTNVHRYGKKYSAQNLCRKITGEKLNFEHFLSYAKEKYKPLYNL